ncbi:hypothetical protein [Deinococcus sp.]|uniref:hypothetical protein n=1 Tax=Deinococcus sp. TaxID=47478 RepID=UPI003C7D36B1
MAPNPGKPAGRTLRDWRQVALGLSAGLLLGGIADLFQHRFQPAWIILVLGLLCLGVVFYLSRRIRRETGRKADRQN